MRAEIWHYRIDRDRQKSELGSYARTVVRIWIVNMSCIHSILTYSIGSVNFSFPTIMVFPLRPNLTGSLDRKRRVRAWH